MSSAAERGGCGRSVRYRLLAIALVPMLIVLPLLLGIGIYRWNLRFNAMMLSKVNDDLTIAHQYLARIRDTTEGQLTAVTQAARFQDLLRRNEAPNDALVAFLADVAAQSFIGVAVHRGAGRLAARVPGADAFGRGIGVRICVRRSPPGGAPPFARRVQRARKSAEQMRLQDELLHPHGIDARGGRARHGVAQRKLAVARDGHRQLDEAACGVIECGQFTRRCGRDRHRIRDRPTVSLRAL